MKLVNEKMIHINFNSLSRVSTMNNWKKILFRQSLFFILSLCIYLLFLEFRLGVFLTFELEQFFRFFSILEYFVCIVLLLCDEFD